MDALVVKIRDNGHVRNQAIHVAIGINIEGKKEVLGLWVTQNEGAKFWLHVMTELKNRGVQDVLIACVDGLRGFPGAIESIFPKAEVQLCIVHLVRASLKYVPCKRRREVAADLKQIYRAATADEAERQLTLFEEKWDEIYPSVSKIWRSNWERVIPFLAYPADIRKVIYTTNAVESLHMTLRKVTKSRGSFLTEEAAIKLLYMALRNLTNKWSYVQGWPEALNQF